MNCLKISTFGTMLFLLGLGFSDTAAGQTLTASPSSLDLTVLSGGATDTQTVNITSSNGATTLFFSLASSPTWLSVNGFTAGQSTDVNTASDGTEAFQVSVNTAGLSTGQQYSGTFLVEVNGLARSALTYTVTLNVGNPSLLSANPSTLTFTASQGASVGSPSSIPVTITSSGAQLGYTVSASTESDTGNWLLLQNTTGTTTSSLPGFTVYVNPSLLTPGNTYSGTITVQSTSTTDSVTIPVTLSVTTGAALNVTGTLNNFIFQYNSGAGTFSPEAQTLMISTTTGSLNYQVQTAYVSGPVQTTDWLLSPTGGLASTTAPGIQLSLSSYQSLAALTPGSYVIDVIICPTGTGNTCPATNVTTVVPVTLVVSNDALLTVNNASFSFSIPFGTSTSQSKLVNVTSSGTTIPYTVGTNQTWLSVQPASGTTPGSFEIFVNASNLTVSSTPYVGTVTVYPNNADFGLYNVPITISLTVTAASTQIFAAPDALLFSQETTMSAPGLQLVELTNTGSPIGFSVSTSTTPASNCPTSDWLSWTASQAVTPATLSITAATTGMTAGSCSGTVTVTYNNGLTTNTTLTIPVTVNIASAPLLTVTPDFGFGVFTATYGSGAAISSRISVNSTDGSALGFTASSSTPGAPFSWLLLGSSSGTTQQYITVQIVPSGFQGSLPIGVYNGSITIHASNSANLPSGDFMLPVTLTVSANTTVSATPTSLSFTQTQGAAPPAPQQISVTAAGGSSTYSASVTPITGGSWLTVTQSSTTASSAASTVTANVLQNSLSPGNYSSNIVLTFQNSATPTITIPVTLSVSAAQTVTVSPTSLNFSYQLGGATPATQNLNVTSIGGAVNITTSTNVGWLVVTPPTGTTGAAGTPLVLGISLALPSLTTAQTYNGTITITPSTGQPPIIVPVTVIVTGVPLPQPGSISNSASGQFGAISPGELITIKGVNLGPATPATFIVAAGNTVSNMLAGVQVLFDNIPGTPTYVSATQINVIVPYEIAGRASTNVVVSYQQQQSAVIPQNVANQAPGIYTFSATGAGQAAVLNQNYTFNGPAVGLVINGTTISTTPAAAGSVIVVYMTGGGQTSPPSTTGTVTPSSPLEEIPLADVTATINGVNAPVQFAGSAPGEVTGVIQVNITVPAGVSGNAQQLVVTINGVASPFGPTVAIQ